MNLIGLVGALLLMSSPSEDPLNRPLDLVVMLETADSIGDFCAAGIVISQDDSRTLILTAAHNLYPDRDFNQARHPLTVEFRNRIGVRYPATPLPGVMDERLDFAVLSIDASLGLPTIPREAFSILPEPGLVQVGTPVRPVGYPNCESWSGPVSASPIVTATTIGVRFETPMVGAGNSGGPLFSNEGALLGMVNEAETHVGLALPTELLIEQLTLRGLSTDWTEHRLATGYTSHEDIFPPVIPPLASSVSVFSGLRARFSGTTAYLQTVDLEQVRLDRDPIAGRFYAYAVFDNGQAALVHEGEDPNIEIRLPREAESFETCGIASHPDGRTFGIRYHWTPWPQKSRERSSGYSDYRSDDVYAGPAPIQVEPDFCARQAILLSEIAPQTGVVQESNLAFSLMSIPVVWRIGDDIVIRTTPSKQLNSDIRFDNLHFEIYRHKNSAWERVARSINPIIFENYFDMQNFSVPEIHVRGYSIGVCTYRTFSGQTAASFEIFEPTTRADGRYTLASERVVRIAEETAPCREFTQNAHFD